MISECEYQAPLDVCQCGNTIFRRGHALCGVCVDNGLDGEPEEESGETVQAEPRQPLAELKFRAAMLERDILNAEPAHASTLARRRIGLWDAIRTLSGEALAVRPVDALRPVILL